MVYTEFSVKCAKSCLAFSFLALSLSSQANDVSIDSSNVLENEVIQEPTFPIYAAELSKELSLACEQKQCVLNPVNNAMLQSMLKQHPLKDEILDAFALSEYELLVSSAIVPSALGHDELMIEMTTSWRGIPVDEFSIKGASEESIFDVASLHIDQWVMHAIENNVFEPEKIYSQIGASDYLSNMQLPQNIGEFVFIETALYHDPMLGSISRYMHPDYSDAIVDVSVYPVSPFIHAYKETKHPIDAEMKIEKENIKALIARANIDDYEISEIQSMRFDSAIGEVDALSIEVALQASIDPIYSTQLLFAQNDKFVKVTGTLPKEMMLALVQDSIKTIAVPEESRFMQMMRQP